jgi:hypothetical protein
MADVSCDDVITSASFKDQGGGFGTAGSLLSLDRLGEVEG